MRYTYLTDEIKLNILRGRKLQLEAEHYEHDMESKLAEELGEGYQDVVQNTRRITDKFEGAIASLAHRIEEIEARQPEPPSAPTA